ncbi:DUF805 domain-containing protein [Hyphobacterium sp.]|uniref:DUF805 domain-containing protein n=1 Tax=Hyphobacterium sp. TaxID=2004662 RepID=UPI003BAD350F
MNLTHVLFSPNGRIGQQEYWIGILIIVGANLLLTWLPFIGTIIWLGLIYVGICVYGKRLHDAGKTAWIHGLVWLMQFGLGIIGFILAGGAILAAISAGGSSGEPNIAAILGASGSLILVAGLGFLIWIVYTIWVGISAGDPGANRFGPPPGVVESPTAAETVTPAAPAAPSPAPKPAPEPEPGNADGPENPPSDKT